MFEELYVAKEDVKEEAAQLTCSYTRTSPDNSTTKVFEFQLTRVQIRFKKISTKMWGDN